MSDLWIDISYFLFALLLVSTLWNFIRHPQLMRGLGLRVCAVMGALLFVSTLWNIIREPLYWQWLMLDLLPAIGAIAFLWWKTKSVGLMSAYRKSNLYPAVIFFTSYLFLWLVITLGSMQLGLIFMYSR